MAEVGKTCCRSSPERCTSCPVVALCLHKIDTRAPGGKRYTRAAEAARVHR